MISPQEVLYLHDRIIERTGGSHGVRDVGLLESALGRPFSTFDGKDLYPSSYLKAAALIHSLLLNHPFVDGNKRTAFAVMNRLLEEKGIFLRGQDREFIEFALWVENKKPEIEEIADWIKKHAARKSSKRQVLDPIR